MTKYLTKAEFSKAKAALTRAKNSGDPHKVVDTVDKTFAAWDDAGVAWPDDWHRWERARDDAKVALAYGTPFRG
jgi:tellurite resistance-related uncharacterized protein